MRSWGSTLQQARFAERRHARRDAAASTRLAEAEPGNQSLPCRTLQSNPFGSS